MTICKICISSNTNKFLSVKGSDIFECKNCHNAFTLPEPPDVNYEIEDFHEQFQYKDVEELPRQWKASLFKQLDLIKKNIPMGSNILEIGCGQGLFLKLLKENGYNTYGIEPSISASKYGNSIGLQIINGYYPNRDLKDIKFDLIIMTHVLEHISNPIDFLKTLAILNKDSYLLLVQTNYKGIVPMKIKHLWYAWLPEQHFWHFTPKGIKSISDRQGFQLKAIEYSSLEHNDYWLSLISEYIPFLGDQFHALIKFTDKK